MFKFFVLFICSYSGNIVIDIDVDVNFSEDGNLLELVREEYLITQKISNATFYLTVSEEDIAKYIFLEINFQYPKNGDVNFITTAGNNKLTSLQNSTIMADYADYNAYYLHKNYHSIVIPAHHFKLNDTLYITNLIRNDRRIYQYILKIRKLVEQPCPKNCSSPFGTCINGICQCNFNKIDLDCSIDAIALNLDQPLDNFTLQGSSYFYFQQETKLEKIQFSFGFQGNFYQDNVKVSLSYMFENFIYGVPIQINETCTLSKEAMKISRIIDISNLTYNANLQRFNRLLLKITTNQESLLQFEISEKPSDNSYNDAIQILITILISLACAFLTLIVGCAIQKCRAKRHRIISVIPQILSESQPYLTLEILQQCLQQAQKGNNQCSICQDQNNNMIQTPCFHTYHAQCLLNWFNNNQSYSCPNCRQVVDFEKIKLEQTKSIIFSRNINPSINQSSINLNQEQAQN
ncbi:unnamed protein product (macronuclear) [Paramecium tetraurelia]|uniref:RING-type domain-containing protein n=1 Tax=Paramecium tetraurelia TaxID=5888 RepID=A0BIZ1_PARTE|nr:uncharacterized protein GSPATT00004881001 [Paramecium tetraurelia]CAK58508.1 unnamed protein product [Paramecium tetraurelia]|eukprot:XP_001425906.1 hypothetical protein (macronuclear) [Paramecium tetraurelia strain d4-2]